MTSNTRFISAVLPAGLLLPLALLVQACGSDGNSGDFDVFTDPYAVSPPASVTIGDDCVGYLASEAFAGPLGTDLNGDGDVVDEVAVVTDLDDDDPTLLGVAGREILIVGDEAFIAVVESEDGRDWNGSGTLDDLVLLTGNDDGVVRFVDTLNDDLRLVVFVRVEDRLYYSSAQAPVGDGTSLRYVDSDNPDTSVVVQNVVGGGTLHPVLLREEEDMIFLILDELVEGFDLNGDGDTTDETVLALLEGSDNDARIQVTGLALADALTPCDSYRVDDDDWTVTFLVDEAGQGGTNLNDPALFPFPLVPGSCAPDTDADDEVMHYTVFKDWVNNGFPIVNTGLVGRGRVVAEERFVATISDETAAGCDLNEDGDMADRIARWATIDPRVIPSDAALMIAVATDVPGGALGMTRLDDKLVIAADEAAQGMDLDGRPADHDLMGWVDPDEGLSAVWVFRHQGSDQTHGTGVFDSNGDSEPYAGTSWMAKDDFGRLPLTYLEEVPGTNPDIKSLNNNSDCDKVTKDTDKTDALPVWADFEGDVLDFDGTGFAVTPDNAGIVVNRNHVFFRLDEALDAFDYNKDGDLDDKILMRNPTDACAPRAMATVSNVPGLVVITDDLTAGAFFQSEAMANADFNGDGDQTDLVVSHFDF